MERAIQVNSLGIYRRLHLLRLSSQEEDQVLLGPEFKV